MTAAIDQSDPAAVGQLPISLGPAHVDFDLTNACNLACSHCHSASGKRLPGELSTAEICDAVDQLHRLGVLTLTFAGGEPFVRRDALEILAHACRLPGWTVTVITNGTLLSDTLLAAMAERCPGLHVNVSIDGSNAQRFGLLRHHRDAGASSYDRLFARVTAAARGAVQHGFRVQINFTLARATADDLRATYGLAVDEIGAAGLLAIKFFPAGYGLEHLRLLEFDYREWATCFQELTVERLDGGLARMMVSVASPWEFYLPLIEGDIDVVAAERAWGYRSPLREPHYAQARDVGDTAGVAHLCITGDGNTPRS